MDEEAWTDEDAKRWKTYSNAADEMEKTLGQQLKPMLENPDTEIGEVARTLAMIVYLTQLAKFDPGCVLDKVKWCLQGIPDTKLKKSTMRWLRKNIK